MGQLYRTEIWGIDAHQGVHWFIFKFLKKSMGEKVFLISSAGTTRYLYEKKKMNLHSFFLYHIQNQFKMNHMPKCKG